MGKTITTKSTKETQDVAKALTLDLTGGSIIALYGDLGAGKTTFTQGLARALGIKNKVNSPTFIIHRSYTVNRKDISKFHHIDLYRIETKSDLVGLGLEELLQQDDAITVIEWPEKMDTLLPKKRIDIKFEYMGENERKISITTVGN